MQPLDVAVFGPLKKGWSKECKEWEVAHNDEAGIKKCGLVPFDPEAPDYTKLTAAASQRENSSTNFEGVNQGGYKEASCQTRPPLTVSRVWQTTVT
ncbi:hypothetical protein SK128_024576 [Halocaridina rubra]|uniref:Uncharacterized protein n=1 Tax=Halocaridina rubra TaxID=373956 RepID=A0AAN8WCI8_HALRR